MLHLDKNYGNIGFIELFQLFLSTFFITNRWKNVQFANKRNTQWGLNRFDSVWSAAFRSNTSCVYQPAPEDVTGRLWHRSSAVTSQLELRFTRSSCLPLSAWLSWSASLWLFAALLILRVVTWVEHMGGAHGWSTPAPRQLHIKPAQITPKSHVLRQAPLHMRLKPNLSLSLYKILFVTVCLVKG